MEEFNVMEHELVPEHRLLSEEEANEVLKKLGVEREQLPKIRKKDPCVEFLERIYGDIPVGSIIKIIRKSPTAGEVVAYRLVVAESLKEFGETDYYIAFEEEGE